MGRWGGGGKGLEKLKKEEYTAFYVGGKVRSEPTAGVLKGAPIAD